MQCMCGCGRETKSRNGYIWGHKGRAVYPEEALNPCACGCGELVRLKWAKGHCNRRPPKARAACTCGCGELASPGRTYVAGHAASSEEQRELRRERMSKLWQDSPEKFQGRRVWSAGLTKDVDPRLAENGRKTAQTFTDEKRERYREFGKATGSLYLPHVTGSTSPNWAGGITEFRKMALPQGESLYTRWKRPILERAGYRCSFCGVGMGESTEFGDPVVLHVHHDVERMATIIRSFIEGIQDLDSLPWEDRLDIWRRIVDYHVQTPVSGMVLCHGCHMRAHRKTPDVD